MANAELTPTPTQPTGILGRTEIIAPAHFVSVYREIDNRFLPDIDKNGLMISHLIIPEERKIREPFIDQFRSDEIIKKGISRNAIYAYPYIEHGNGLMGFADKFRKREDRFWITEYERFLKYDPSYLKKLGINDAEEYIAKMNDRSYFRSLYRREILEFKVDPFNTYAADMEYVTRMSDEVRRYHSEKEGVRDNAGYYWASLITLADFLRWYKKPEWEENGNDIKDADLYEMDIYGTTEFYKIKGAPPHLPVMYYIPEILIPYDVAKDLIKVVK